MKKAGLVLIAFFILFSFFSCATENPAARNVQTADDDSSVDFLPVDRPVLVNNLWKKPPAIAGAPTR
ncbi:MAG: hypothetical protein LBG10_05795, partial [Treponema sp.]|nr:hypothetical protein [Treponema sp.]